MLFSIEKKKLEEILNLASKFVSKSSTLPVLENIYISAGLGEIIFKATDMEKYINIHLKNEVLDTGSITVNVKMFYDIIKMIDDEQINLSTEDDILIIQSSSDEFKLKGISATEYVSLPNVEKSYTYEIAKQILISMKKVFFSISEKNFSPILTGVLVRFKNDHIIFAGTDGFRLAEYKVEYPIGITSDFVIPISSMEDILKVIEFSNDDININIYGNENLIVFKYSINEYEIETGSVLLQGEYPNYDNESIIPKNFNGKIIVNADLLQKSIKKILTFTKGDNNWVEFNVIGNEIKLSSGFTDLGSGLVKLPCNHDGNEIDFAINGKFVLEFIGEVEGDYIVINYVDNEKPIIFKDFSDEKLIYVVRPLIK